MLERDYPQYGLCGTRSVALNLSNALNLRLFFDSSSVEVFVNEGEACLSSRIYPDADCRELALFAGREARRLFMAGRGSWSKSINELKQSPIHMGLRKSYQVVASCKDHIFDNCAFTTLSFRQPAA